MNQHKVRPNLLTFNAVLKALRRCGYLSKTQALHTLNEMKALGIGNYCPGSVSKGRTRMQECQQTPLNKSTRSVVNAGNPKTQTRGGLESK